MAKRTLKSLFGLRATTEEAAANNETAENTETSVNNTDEIKINKTFKNAFDLGENGSAEDAKTWVEDAIKQIKDMDEKLEVAVKKNQFESDNLENTRALTKQLRELQSKLSSSMPHLVSGAMSALRNHNRPDVLRGLDSLLSPEATQRSDFKTITENELNVLYNNLSKEERQSRLDAHLANCYNADLMMTLIKAGADSKVNDQTVLRRAAMSGETDLIKLLHERGADFDAAILLETTKNHPPVVKKLQAYQKKFTGEMSDYSPKLDKEIISELQQNVQDLTAQCKKLAAAQQTTKQAPKKAPKKAKQTAQKNGPKC